MNAFSLLSKVFPVKSFHDLDADYRKRRRAKYLRKSRGNMIAFISAVTLGLVLAILFFALKYTRMLGSNQEQRTAIEGSALQVANDISRITFEDPNYGMIALSDFAPIGYDTAAKDGQFTPVRGINTILGTVRLDLIIADQLGNAEMMLLADDDYNNAIKALNSLQAELTDACLPVPTQQHRDWDGNVVNVNQDAVDVYKKNVIRMNGTQTALDPKSVQITLGILKNGASTNTPIPQPSNLANVSSDQTRVQTFPNNQQVTCYKSYTNISYTANNGKNYPFVFCGTDNSLKLVDQNQFTTNIAAQNLPYALASIVKVEGDQIYQNDNNSSNNSKVHAIAYAQPASAGDPRPYPGAMVIGFPGGAIPEIQSPGDILGIPYIAKIPMNVKTSDTGDTGSDPIVPILTYPGMGAVGSTGGYHHIRRAGTRPNITSVVAAYGKAFSTVPVNGGTGTGLMYIYTFDSNGNMVVTARNQPVNRMMLESEHQLISKSLANFQSKNKKTYGAVTTDLVAFPGTKFGGQHAGEPLLGQGPNNGWDGTGDPSGIVPSAATGILGSLVALVVLPALALISGLLQFLFGHSATWAPAVIRPPHVTGSGPRVPRDTYTKQGLAVDMEFPEVKPGLW